MPASWKFGEGKTLPQTPFSSEVPDLAAVTNVSSDTRVKQFVANFCSLVE
jgi:hypothetical protein